MAPWARAALAGARGPSGGGRRRVGAAHPPGAAGREPQRRRRPPEDPPPHTPKKSANFSVGALCLSIGSWPELLRVDHLNLIFV